jgi:hypothetical protein
VRIASLVVRIASASNQKLRGSTEDEVLGIDVRGKKSEGKRGGVRG